ncbi:ABC transporter ATP-binding protein [Roseovarius dicentrarchi]|uniref:ABC transporter ATP-binding protein n=1 Tax=Roseovarius dicentrarchi TaxID=2250573 RepID=UPI001EEFF635|nr:ABC transporter ATP-binding protein [Roseovarius dicentrarchi]
MTDTILALQDVHKSFGEAKIIQNANLDVHRGERHAIIGPNGAGKSTLFHLCSGQFAPTSGKIVLNGKNIAGLKPAEVNRLGLARSFQITNIFPGVTVLENLRLAVMRKHNLQFVFWRSAARLKKVNQEVDDLLTKIRLTERAHSLASEMSYSEQRSLEIGMTLASDPQVILLDEPMAGMSQEETDYTSGLIREITDGRTLLIVEHDMSVVFSLAHRISVLVYGEIIATGTPEESAPMPA